MKAPLANALAPLRSALGDLRQRGPQTVALIAVCSLLLAVGPLALTLSRTEYEASSSIAQSVDLPKYARAEEVDGVTLVMAASINSPGARRQVAQEVAWLDSPGEVATRVKLTARWRRGRPEAVFTAHAPTPDQARELVSVTTRTMHKRAEVVARWGDAYKSTLRGGGRAFNPPEWIRSEGARPVDAALAALPGPLPPPPAPGWAVVAGLALAVTLNLAVVAVGRQRAH